MASTANIVLAVAGAAVWGVWSAGCGYAAHRTPRARLEHDGWLLRLRPFEQAGVVYERVLRIKRWKDALPEAGALFRGGVSKRHLRRHDRASLETFTVATRRAEVAHWPILALAPTFLVWIPLLDAPWWLATALVAYGIVANLPCILVQRYNRARLQRILGRRAIARPVGGEE